MFEDFVSTLVAERRRVLCPNADLDGYCDHLVALGYSRATIQHKLWIVGTFLAWVAGRKLSIEDLDDGQVAACISSRSKLGRTCHDFRLTLLQLLEFFSAGTRSTYAGKEPSPSLLSPGTRFT